jgi:hypothetical protein
MPELIRSNVVQLSLEDLAMREAWGLSPHELAFHYCRTCELTHFTVRRSWLERLFSWPWRPWAVENYVSVPKWWPRGGWCVS